MAGRVCRLTEQLCEARAKEKEAVYTALQAQINPHFLYNTLDMISWMGYGASNEDICKVVASLSDFFRLSLNKGEDSFTLADELDHVKSYVTIQEYRMRHIQFRLEAPRELLNLRVPKLMVQPLVENAILHGLRPRNYRGHITISCALEQAYPAIRVMDDGVGFDEKLLGERTEKSTSYGLKNIRQRLAVLDDDRGSLEIANRPEGGVVARLRYPAEEGGARRRKGRGRMRILIADDEAFVVEGLTLLLHQNLPQVEIMTADNGRSALAVLRERGAEPDLLITDLNMPLMDGIELSQQIRRRYPRCRIMIISGYEGFEAARSAIELGALRYMLQAHQPHRDGGLCEIRARGRRARAGRAHPPQHRQAGEACWWTCTTICCWTRPMVAPNASTGKQGTTAPCALRW